MAGAGPREVLLLYRACLRAARRLGDKGLERKTAANLREIFELHPVSVVPVGDAVRNGWRHVATLERVGGFVRQPEFQMLIRRKADK